jgi:Siphovirus protein of unknown function (DUF859)
MALGGTNYTNVGSHWRLQIEWSATQNISANTSTITQKLYWIALDGYGAVYSSASKDGSQTINGSASSFSGASAALSANQKKLIDTHVVTVTHNSDGTKSASLSAYFDIEVTLGGTYYGRVSVSGTASLNTIPRASTLSSSASWTAGGSVAVSINRASSSFVHSVYLWVNGVQVGYAGNVGSSVTITPDNTEIFNQLNTSSSQDTKISIVTYPYSGASSIGSNDYTGTVTAPSASTTSSPSSFNIGDTFTVGINRADSEFTHTIRLKNGGTVVKTYTGQGTSTSFSTSDIDSTLYSYTPNSNSISLTIECITYYGGEQVRTPTTETITANVTNSNPSFSASQIAYSDVNTVTTAVTGNNQYIVQNKSTLRATVSTAATGVNSATITSYLITINGVSKPLTAPGYQDMGTVDASSNITMTVKVTDSRGNSTTVSKTVLMVPYANPIVTTTATRLNNFEAQTTITLTGSISLLNVAGANKNAITATTGLQYRYKESTSGTWGGWTDFVWTTSGANYTATNIVLTLDSLKAYNIEVRAQDKLVTTTVSKNVSVGQPLMFIDSVKKSIGVNMFPVSTNSFDVSNRVQLFPTVSSVKAASIFTADTYKSYLSFNMVSGSNDPAHIMHETSGVTADSNKGVLHLCPSDDNDNTNDYVTIHGTNDPETIKLYTGGNAWFQGSIRADGGYTGRLEINQINTNVPMRFYAASGYSSYMEIFNNGSATRTAYIGHSSYSDNDFVIYTYTDAGVGGVGRCFVYGHLAINGTSELQFPTYGGGWFMQDTTWIRAVGNKNVYTPGTIQAGTSINGQGANHYFGSAAGSSSYLECDSTGARFHFDANSYMVYTDTTVGFYINGAVKHFFKADGTKTGGSIVIDGENLGMSPVDSPRILLTDLITDIELNPYGIKISLENRFAKALSSYSIFPNNPTAVIVEKGHDYFIVKGEGISDFKIEGTRIGFEGKYWDNMGAYADGETAKESTYNPDPVDPELEVVANE